MSKKIFVLVSILFAILFIHSFTFATIDVANGMQKLGNDVRGGIQNAENAITDTFTNVTNDVNNNTTNNNYNDTAMGNTDLAGTDDGYTATRTTTDGTTTGMLAGMSGTTWTWVTLAIVAVVIVALVWYYATQDTKRD